MKIGLAFACCACGALDVPVAPGMPGTAVVAHVAPDSAPCVDRYAACATFDERYYFTSATMRRVNLEQLLTEIGAWPGEPATYDLGPPAGP